MKITISPLKLPLKTNFKQASSSRNLGESIWVTASRDNITGFGEGCPRVYVTGEDIPSGLHWLQTQLAEIEQECTDLQSLQTKVAQASDLIDQHPAAWCAIETALLDLFAKEQKQSVEKMLGFHPPRGIHQYAAILSDSAPQQYQSLVEKFIQWGFSDFKIKLNGDLDIDQMKLEFLREACEKARLKNYRLRLDANNLWSGETQQAIGHLAQLDLPILGIEEPVEPKHPEALSLISQALHTAAILDESLCNMADLVAYDGLAGQFIANIKVSRVGGLLRSLQLIEALKKRNWKIIIGAHVGETSVLTRAAICAAQAAGQALISQEGAFGTILLEREPVYPSLMFGAGGRIDLSETYRLQTASGMQAFPVATWDYGWGLVAEKDF